MIGILCRWLNCDGVGIVGVGDLPDPMEQNPNLDPFVSIAAIVRVRIAFVIERRHGPKSYRRKVTVEREFEYHQPRLMEIFLSPLCRTQSLPALSAHISH